MKPGPYEPIECDDRGDAKSRYLDLGDFELHGSTIQCGSNLFLPTYCVVSGTDDDLEIVERSLVCLSPVAKVMAIFLLPVAIVIPFGRLLLAWGLSSNCHVTYFVERRLIRRSRILLAIGVCLLIAAFVWLAFVAPDFRAQGPQLLIGPVTLFLVTLGLAFGFGISPYPIRVVAFKDGGQYWIRGFKEPFIQRLEEM
ncbi:MAG: hypothetical protein O2856_07795 [Planctomycetota bacterium]|nr:hypothetical protein [Planctomycetota bacterium]